MVIDRSSNYILDPIEQSLKQDLPWEGYRITVARDSWPWDGSEPTKEEAGNIAKAFKVLFMALNIPNLGNPSSV